MEGLKEVQTGNYKLNIKTVMGRKTKGKTRNLVSVPGTVMLHFLE
jgi:hypothetical protein